MNFNKFIQTNLKRAKPTIGFGLAKPNPDVLDSLKKSSKYAKIILYGPKAINVVSGFSKVISSDPEIKLAQDWWSRKVHGIIRGTIDDFKTRETCLKLIGNKKIDKTIEVGLLEDVLGRQFIISESSNGIGWTLIDKIETCEQIVKFLKSLKIKPKIGCITGIRHETYQRKKQVKDEPQKTLNKTYEYAEKIVRHFRNKSISAKNYSIEIETALKDGCNIIVPPNGTVGNQVFRSLLFFGGAKFLAAPLINFPYPYEDNFRNEVDYQYHVKWLVAYINNSRGNVRKIK